MKLKVPSIAPAVSGALNKLACTSPLTEGQEKAAALNAAAVVVWKVAQAA